MTLLNERALDDLFPSSLSPPYTFFVFDTLAQLLTVLFAQFFWRLPIFLSLSPAFYIWGWA